MNNLEKSYVNKVCKIGKGSDCCRYLVVGRFGFECIKFTELKNVVDRRVEAGTMVAKGDNCPGKDNE